MYVQTTVANGTLADVDPAEALAMPGVVAFISAADIPGENNICSDGLHTEQVSVLAGPSGENSRGLK